MKTESRTEIMIERGVRVECWEGKVTLAVVDMYEERKAAMGLYLRSA
jgi:hypothetical protein